MSNHQPSSAADIDYSAFSRHYSLADRISKNLRYTSKQLGKNAVLVVLALFLSALVIACSVYFINLYRSGGPGTEPLLAIMAIVLISIVFVFVRFLGFGKHQLVLEQFCADNSFNFSPQASLDNVNASLFRPSNNVINLVTGMVDGKQFSFFQRSIDRRLQGATREDYQVMMVPLTKKFPHIVLNNRHISGVDTVQFDRSQRLELEWDFSQDYEVYGPQEYEIEVLQLLNPSFMNALLNLPGPADVEIIDDSLYIYLRGHKLSQTTVKSLFDAMSVVVGQVDKISPSYKVTPIGDYQPRLSHSVWPVVILILLVIIIVVLLKFSM